MSETRYFSIEALDTLFFRDGRPFNAGDESWTSGLFPPMPSVFCGFLRSLFFSENMKKLSKAGASDDPSTNLALRYLSLAQDNQPIFPIPSDVVFVKDDDDYANPKFLTLAEAKGLFAASSYPVECSHILNSPFPVKLRELGGRAFIPAQQMEAYLGGKIIAEVLELKDMLTSEPKIGLGRNKAQRIAEEGMLYTLQMQRPETLSTRLNFIIGYGGADITSRRGLERLGGEGKMVHFMESPPMTSFTFPVDKAAGRKFKMYLATSAVFSEGWYPGSLFNEWKVELLAASVNKSISIGGWNMRGKQRGPKPMMKAVPAGSVYYLQATPATKWDDVEEQHGKPLTDKKEHSALSHYCREGLGIVYFGKCQTS